MKVKDMVIISVLAIILFLQDELLSFIPNVQLSAFLIILYSKKLGLIKTSIIVTIYVLLDNLMVGSFYIAFFIPMLIGWLFIPLLISIFFKKTENSLILALGSILFALIYSLCFALMSVIVYKVDFYNYMLMDIPYEIPLVISSFVSTLLLYKPLSKVFDKFYVRKDA